MKKTGKITLDGFVTVDGVWDDEVRWNGFLCPSMSREAVEIVLTALRDQPGDQVLEHEWDGDVLVLSDHYSETEVQVDRLEPDADGLYALGAWGWVWSEA